MTPRSNKLLFDLLTNAEAAERLLGGVAASEMRTDSMKFAAAMWHFTVVGEASRRLHRDDPMLAASLSGIESIVAFRNRVVHGYDSIRADLIAEIVREDLPVLIRQVSGLLES